METSGERWALPEPSHVKECIAKWRGLDLRASSDEEIEKSLLDLRDSIGSCLVQRTSKVFRQLWRVRRNGRCFVDAKDFWYPPKELTKQGRCNRPGEPVLYASPLEITALDEMSAEKGDRLVLTQFRSTRNLRFDRVVGFEDPNPVYGVRVLDGDDLVSYRLLREFIRAEFMKEVADGDEHCYRLSAAICRTWTNSDCADGWIYPSVRNAQHVNVAIKPRIADRYLEIVAAFLVEVQGLEIVGDGRVRGGQGIELKILDTASVTADAASWSGRVGSKFAYRLSGQAG